MLKIIGTTHLDKKEEVEERIKKENPDVIGIELCQIREYIYLHNVDTKGDDDSLLGKISNSVKKKAKENNVEYGSDMYAALEYARKNNIPYVLVDKRIDEIKEIFQKIPQNEMEGFLKEIEEFKSRPLQKEVDEEKTLTELKQKYPISFEILITLRELHITNQILKTMIKYPNKKIVVILGKGHLKGVTDLLK